MIQHDAVRRTGRGFVQGGLAEGLLRLLESFGIITITEDQHATLLLVLIPVVTLIQNALEDRYGRSFLIQKVPGDYPIPMPDEGVEPKDEAEYSEEFDSGEIEPKPKPKKKAKKRS